MDDEEQILRVLYELVGEVHADVIAWLQIQDDHSEDQIRAF